MVKVELDNFSEDLKQILDAMRSLEIQPSAVDQESDDNTKPGDILTPTATNIQRRAELIQQIYRAACSVRRVAGTDQTA